MGFFERYNADGLQLSYEGRIAYSALRPIVDRELENFEGIERRDICFPIDSIGLAHAVHPGHENGGSGYKGRSQVSDEELTKIFNARSRKDAPIAEMATPSSTAVSSTVKPAANAAAGM